MDAPSYKKTGHLKRPSSNDLNSGKTGWKPTRRSSPSPSGNKKSKHIHLALLEISKAALAAKDIESFCRSTPRFLRRIFPGNVISLTVNEPAIGRIQVHRSSNLIGREDAYLRLDAELTDEVFRSSKILSAGAPQIRERMSTFGIKPSAPLSSAWLGIPLKAGEKRIGVLSFLNLGKAPTSQKWDLATLTLLSTLVALVIERLQTHKALAEKEATARALLNATPDAASLLGTDGTILTVNNKFAERFQRTAEELTGANIHDFLPFEIIKSRRAWLDPIIASGVPSEHTDFRNGIWMENWAYPILDEQGRTSKIAIFSRDITERKKTNEALQESNQWSKAIFNFVQTSIVVIDAVNHVIVDVNPAACQAIGAAREDIIGQVCHKFICPAELGRCPVTDLGQTVDKSERNLLTLKGETIPILKSVISTTMSGRSYLVESFLDIAERKKAEEALRASLHEKEVLVREIHHRVKNNMQVITSLINHHARFIQDKAVSHIFEECRNRIRSMALVHEKLYQSKDMTRIDFSQYLESLAIHLFQSYSAASKRIKLETRLESVSLDLNTAIPLGLIVNELISNALEHAFNPDREGRIIIQILEMETDTYKLIIKDDGIGLPADFSLLSQKTLGMQIVALLAKQLEGTVEITGGKGTEVTVYFKELKYASSI